MRDWVENGASKLAHVCRYQERAVATLICKCTQHTSKTGGLGKGKYKYNRMGCIP